MHAIRKLSVTEHPRPFENTVFPKTNTWKRMWGYFKAWAFKTYSIQAFIDHAFYLRYLRYLVIGQKQNFLGANGNSHPKRFSESSIVPSFLFGEAESESFPRETLVNEPDKYGEIIAVVSLNKNLKESTFSPSLSSPSVETSSFDNDHTLFWHKTIFRTRMTPKKLGPFRDTDDPNPFRTRGWILHEMNDPITSHDHSNTYLHHVFSSYCPVLSRLQHTPPDWRSQS